MSLSLSDSRPGIPNGRYGPGLPTFVLNGSRENVIFAASEVVPEIPV